MLEHRASFSKDGLKGPFRTTILPWVLDVREELFGAECLMNPNVEEFVELLKNNMGNRNT
jgi:hypothetical protein